MPPLVILVSLTRKLINIKTNAYPGLVRGSSFFLDGILPEVKGSEIRSHIAGRRGDARQAIRVLDEFMER